MATTALDRLAHIRERIALIRALLADTTYEAAYADPTRWAAYERHLEVISEASKSIPDAWKVEGGAAIAWPKVIGLGSLLRHAYQHASGPILWDIYINDLDPLEAAIDAMLAANPPPPSRS